MCFRLKVLKTNIAHDDIAARRGIECELTINIGDRLDVGTLDLHGGSYDRLTIRVGHGTCNFVVAISGHTLLRGMDGNGLAADDNRLWCDNVVREVTATERLIEDFAHRGLLVAEGDVRFVVDNLGLIGEAVGCLLLNDAEHFSERRVLHSDAHSTGLSIGGNSRQQDNKQCQKAIEVFV